MMDDFLSQLRELPRPAFAAELRERLAQAEQLRQRRARTTMLARIGGTAAVGMSLAFALAWGGDAGFNRKPTASTPLAKPTVLQAPSVASALFVPVSQPASAVPVAWPLDAAESAESLELILKVPMTPVSHHH